MNKLILIGAGGHSKVIRDIISLSHEYDLYAVLDDAITTYKNENGVIYYNTKLINEIDKNKFKYFISIGDNKIREEIFNRLGIGIKNFATLIHPSAIISKSVKIGYGTAVMPNVVINADSVIGNHCIINTSCIIEHDNVIADFAHISPNATLAGGVKIGKGTHIGAGASIIPNISVGFNSIIGAGAVVIRDIPNNCTAVGVPAKVIHHIEMSGYNEK